MEDNAGAASSATTGEIGAVDGGAGNIKIKVSYGSNNFDVFTSPQSTFGTILFPSKFTCLYFIICVYNFDLIL
ncbi:hypothetical protein Hanom_Chr15g01338921 [Helianthus anomalus]